MPEALKKPAASPPKPPTTPAAEPVEKSGGGNKGLLIGGVLGLIALIAVAAIVLGGGGGEPKRAASNPEPTTEAVSEPAEAAIDAAYQGKLDELGKNLGPAADGIRGDLASAKTNKSQAIAAKKTASIYDRSTDEMGNSSTNTPEDTALNEELLAALDATTKGWSQLSSAANRSSKSAYGKAQDAVAAGEADLEKAFAGLTSRGYTVPSITIGDPIPALKAKKKAKKKKPTSSTNSSPSSPQPAPTAAPAQPQQSTPVQPQQNTPAPPKPQTKPRPPTEESGGDS